MRNLNQSGLLSQETMDEWAIGIIGAGAIGSFVAMALTKMGIKNMVCWDPDKIEEHNISNQMFPVDSVGKRKAVAVREMVKQFSGENILTVATKAKKITGFMNEAFPNSNHMYLLCVDSLDVRKELAQELNKDPHLYVIDARMGAKTYRVLGFVTGNAVEFANYMGTLVPDSEAVQERCGQKSIIYTVLGVAAEVCSFVHRTMAFAETEPVLKSMPPVVFDYGTGMRIERRPPGKIEKLSEMPDAADQPMLVPEEALEAHPF